MHACDEERDVRACGKAFCTRKICIEENELATPTFRLGRVYNIVALSTAGPWKEIGDKIVVAARSSRLFKDVRGAS